MLNKILYNYMTENKLKAWPFIEAKKLLKKFENSKKK